MKTLGAALKAEKEKIRKHGENSEKVEAVFVPYVVETFGGLAPEAQTLNKKISTFAEEHSITENRDDFLQKLKSEIASAVQYGNYRVATKAIQQSKVTLKIPQKNSGVEDFLSNLMEGEKPREKIALKHPNTVEEKMNKRSYGNKFSEEKEVKYKKQKNQPPIGTTKIMFSDNNPPENLKSKQNLKEVFNFKILSTILKAIIQPNRICLFLPLNPSKHLVIQIPQK